MLDCYTATRVFCLALFLYQLSVRAYYGGRAQAYHSVPNKYKDSEDEPAWQLRLVLIFGTFPWLFFLVYLLNLLPPPPSCLWTYAGCFFALLGSALFHWSHQALGSNWFVSVRVRTTGEHKVVSHGPYALVRH